MLALLSLTVQFINPANTMILLLALVSRESSRVVEKSVFAKYESIALVNATVNV